MRLTSPLLCHVGRHDPLRRNVEWDGSNYVGRCRHCDKPIERIAHRRWRTASS